MPPHRDQLCLARIIEWAAQAVRIDLRQSDARLEKIERSFSPTASVALVMMTEPTFSNSSVRSTGPTSIGAAASDVTGRRPGADVDPVDGVLQPLREPVVELTGQPRQPLGRG